MHHANPRSISLRKRLHIMLGGFRTLSKVCSKQNILQAHLNGISKNGHTPPQMTLTLCEELLRICDRLSEGLRSAALDITPLSTLLIREHVWSLSFFE